MRKLRLLLLGLTAGCILLSDLTSPAWAESCSQRYRTCRRVCPMDNPAHQCPPACARIFQECLQTGCWSTRVANVCGYVQR